jgi:hypothetical protein
LPVERDKWRKPEMSLAEYADDAREHGATI